MSTAESRRHPERSMSDPSSQFLMIAKAIEIHICDCFDVSSPQSTGKFSILS